MTQKIKEISLDLIDDPKSAMRGDVNDDGIEELALSIKKYGLFQPVTVFKKDGRFEIIAGHRRTTASRRAGLAKIPCLLHGGSDEEKTVLQIHENLLRRDVNPVDEAVFIANTLEKTGGNPKGFASMINRSESYVRERLDLLSYPDYLIEAIGEKQVSLSAAHWLNKITEEKVRSAYVGFAISGGITTKRAYAWFLSWEAGQLPNEPTEFQDTDVDTGAPVAKQVIPCVLCGQDDELGNLTLDYMHANCRVKIRA